MPIAPLDTAISICAPSELQLVFGPGIVCSVHKHTLHSQCIKFFIKAEAIPCTVHCVGGCGVRVFSLDSCISFERCMNCVYSYHTFPTIIYFIMSFFSQINLISTRDAQYISARHPYWQIKALKWNICTALKWKSLPAWQASKMRR